MADNHITIFRANDKYIIPKFVLYCLANIGFKTIEKMAKGASGQIELAIDTIGNLAIPVPSIQTQKQVITKIEALEQKIQDTQAIIDNISAKKQQVLDNYL